TRLAPDAPIPVVDRPAESARPGGAALAAWLAAGLGADVTLVTPLADDEPAHRLRELLAGRVRVTALPYIGNTAVKRRVRANGQSLVRIDTGDEPAPIGWDPAAAWQVLSD